MENQRVCPIRRVRTEEAKAIRRRTGTNPFQAKRRIYGDRGGHLHFSEHKYVPRPDGISNAITTFDKDNYVLVTYGQPIKF